MSIFGPRYIIRSDDGKNEMRFWRRSSYQRELDRIELEKAKRDGNYHRIAMESYDEYLAVKKRLFEIGAKIVEEDEYNIGYISPVFIKVEREYPKTVGDDYGYVFKIGIFGKAEYIDKIKRGMVLQ